MSRFFELLVDAAVWFFIGAVLLVFGGAAAAGWMVVDAKHEIDRRDRLTAECVAGNENACRIYEADFARRARL